MGERLPFKVHCSSFNVGIAHIAVRQAQKILDRKNAKGAKKKKKFYHNEHKDHKKATRV
jgi:hypothetical protein